LLKENGCEKIFSDVTSGVRENRDGLNEMLSYLRKGDVIMVYKTYRIFRSLKNMIELIEKFKKKVFFLKALRNLLLILHLRMENLLSKFLVLLQSLKEI
jgi:DNA invertase Pin-like site-specific DNA recombinase